MAYFLKLLVSLCLLSSTFILPTVNSQQFSEYSQISLDTIKHLYSRNSKINPEKTSQFVAQAALPSYIQDFLGEFNQQENETYFFDFEKLFVGVDSADCKGHVAQWALRFVNGSWLTEKDKWAAQMVDSWGKYPEGVLTGHINLYGDFDECIRVSADDIEILESNYPVTSKSFKGLYCTSYVLDYFTASGVAENGSEAFPMASIEQSGNITLQEYQGVVDFLLKMIFQRAGMIMLLPTVATCFPNTCSVKDVQNIVMNAAKMMYTRNGIPELLHPVLPWPVTPRCTEMEKPGLDAPAIIVLVILFTLIAIAVVATLTDYFLTPSKDKKDEKPPNRGIAFKYLMAFSFYTNTKKWLSTRRSADDLGCLHGIRFFSTTWVILCHTYTTFADQPQWNLVDVKNIWKDWTMLTVLNGSLSVDTFFVMSGMLVTYNLLKHLDKTKGKLNVPMFYIQRIVRLTPTYAIIIGISATLLTYLGNGPNWYRLYDMQDNCRKYWYANLLYINNVHHVGEMCNQETWYMANDMQFFILSPLIIYPLWKWKLGGLYALTIWTLLSIASPMLVAEFYPAPPTMILSQTVDILENAFEIYHRPWVRLHTFLVGVWLGYALHVTKDKKLNLPHIFVMWCWIVSTGTALASIYGIHSFFNPDNAIPKDGGILYAGFGRVAFACSIAWVIFACIKGYGGIVNSFLSWSVFMPLGRLCFCVYLISPSLQNIFHLNLNLPVKYSPYTMVNFYFAHIVMSFLMGFLATMLFETPFMILQRLIFEGK